MIENDVIREEYGLESNAARSIHRTVDRLSGNSDRIVAFLGKTMKRKYGLRMQTVFMGQTTLFFVAPQQGIVRVGYSRDHRPGRVPEAPGQATIDRLSF